MFSTAVAQFVELHCKRRNRRSTARETERVLRYHFVSEWSDRPVTEITKAEVLAIVDRAIQKGTPGAANHALATVRVFFNWCVERGLVNQNPCRDLRAPARKVSRDRVLSDTELARVWQEAAAIGYPFGTLVLLLILTAQRRREVACMEWSQLNTAERVWEIPAQLSKNGKIHRVPLTRCSMEIIADIPRIDHRFVFPSMNGGPFATFGKPKAQLARRAGVDFKLHDLRRTAATNMAKLRIDPHVIERVLNHVTGILGGIAGVYNRFKYTEEMRAALEFWADHIALLDRTHKLCSQPPP
jgi:integrase